MNKSILSIIGVCLFVSLSGIHARVYQRNPGDLLNAQWLDMKGWSEGISRTTLINGVEHQTHLWQVDQPIHLVLRDLEHLYRQTPDPGHFSLGEHMAWGDVQHQNLHQRYLLFSITPGSGTLVMRVEAPPHVQPPTLDALQLLPPGVTHIRSIQQPDSDTELIQARSNQSPETLRAFYNNHLRSEGWSKGLGDLYLKDGKMRMVHLLSTGQGNEVQISIVTADLTPQLENTP